MLSIHNAAITAGNRTILTIEHAEFQAGQLISLIGPNGAGKSTLLRSLLGRYPACVDKVLLQHKRLDSYSLSIRSQWIAYLPQTMQCQDGYTVEELIQLADVSHPENRKRRSSEIRMQEALELCQLGALRERLVATLSGGEKQRVYLAQVIYQDTPILLLDEPSSFLDLSHTHLLEIALHRLREEGKLILFATHDLFSAWNIGTHAMALKEGRMIAWGETHNVLTPECLAEIFDVSAEQLQLRYPWLNPVETLI